MADEFDRLIGTEFPEEPTAGDVRPNLGPLKVAGFYLCEAATQIVDAFHLQNDMLTRMVEHPEYPEVQVRSPLGYLEAHRDEDDPMTLLDIMETFQVVGIAMGVSLSEWAGEHDLPGHIHLWVYLTGHGAMPCILGHGEGQPQFVLPFPQASD